jgi:hypothetical protein
MTRALDFDLDRTWPEIDTEWQDLFARYQHARLHADAAGMATVLEQTRACLRDLHRGGWRWLYRHLGMAPVTSPGRRDVEAFSRAVLQDAGPHAPHLLSALVRAAIDDTDPSFNRWHIEPALHAFGTRRVYEACLGYLEHGTLFEIAGAAAALYWVEAKGAGETVADLREQKRLAFLTAFVNVDDVQVRRYTLPHLSLSDPASYPEHARHLVAEAITIARAHPDAYIRHRLAVQLGEESTLQPIPNRTIPQLPECDT